MGELHGTKALIFLMMVVAVVAILTGLHTVAPEVFTGVLFASLGYAFGNTILKKHTKQEQNAIDCSHDTCPGCSCFCHKGHTP